MSRRIGILTASLLVLLTLISAAASVALIVSANTVRSLSTGYAPAVEANATALVDVLRARDAVQNYAISGRAADRVAYRHAAARVLPTVRSVGGALHKVGEHGVDAALAAEERATRRWLRTTAPILTDARPAARKALDSRKLRRSFTAYRAANARVGAAVNRIRSDYRGRSSTERALVLPFVIVVAALILAGVAIAVRVIRSVARPQHAVRASLRQLESGDLSARADDSRGPAEIRELAAAVNDLAVERRRAHIAQKADSELRRQVRAVTSAIRLGSDATAIARTLVAGLGRAYDVDRVWLQTFDVDRVPVLTEQWRRSGAVPEIVPTPGEADDLASLADRLWQTGSMVAVSDHAAPAHDVDTRLLHAPLSNGARSSMVIALGEGAKAVGLLWVSTLTEQRTWTSAEMGLLQHVAAELAQHLMQNQYLLRQQETMRRLRAADEAKTALVSTVSHELRTPLTSIIGYLDVLLDMDEAALPPEVASMLHVIARNANRLRALIEDLLTQSQIEAGRRLVELGRVDVTDVLGEVQDTTEPLAANAHLTLRLDVPPRGVLVVDGDSRQLGQAITNLVANAIKFTPRGGRVTLAAEHVHDGNEYAEIRVVDTGIGIPAEEVPHLFDRFFRATNARKAVIQGTGLGLAIAAEIVAQHGGTIDVASELGAGTTIVIRLPFAGAERHVGNTALAAMPGTVEAAADPVRES